MALNNARLRSDLGNLYDFMGTVTDPAQGKSEYINRMEALITRFVQSGEAVGQIVTTGSASSQTATVKLSIQ